MRESIRQRIVGAIVLLALAVVLVPVLFNLDPPRPIDTRTQIPAAPDITPTEIPQPERVAGLPQPKQEEEVFMPPEPESLETISAADGRETAEEKNNSEAVEKPAPTVGLNEDQLLKAWVIQVASYQEGAAADDLVKRLQQAGFKAYSRSAKSGGKTVNRVFVGPVVLKERAEEYKAKVDKEFRVSSLILPFEP